MDGRSAYDTCLENVLRECAGSGWAIDTPHIRKDVTAYLLPSFMNDALIFSVPVLFSRPLFYEIHPDARGADGAVHLLIEKIKSNAQKDPALGPLVAAGTLYPNRYDATTEPYTIVHSEDAIGSHLWHPDDRNFCDSAGIHLLIRGALPCPGSCSPHVTHKIQESLQGLLDAVSKSIGSVPATALTRAWELSLDQKILREMLDSLGLVAFVGDRSCPARSFTRHRSFFRIAGKKAGIHIPFACPQELSPVEIDLPATNEQVTGLGIRKREVFAVTGSNAQGKTTFLSAILAGMDDHAYGDGREHIVTVRGVQSAEAMNCELKGADISMFFSALPPGIGGTVQSAYGMGSGSMTMASMIQRALAGRAPLLIIDEDRAAPNLLVRSCLQTGDVTPLAEILSRSRGTMQDSTLLFAACAMDTLIAQADRIMVLERHAAAAINPASFRRQVAMLLRKTADELELP